MVVVDEEVYRLLPALVIATVDKFARMPWEGRVQALFGQVSRRCERHGYLTPGEEHPRARIPSAARCRRSSVHAVRAAAPAGPDHPGRAAPDLRAAREPRRAVRDGGRRALRAGRSTVSAVRPKVIASTATIRRAGDQVARLFDRRLAVFPPPGLDARDSFFALQRDQPDGSGRAARPPLPRRLRARAGGSSRC